MKKFLKKGFSGDLAARKCGLKWEEWKEAKREKSIRLIIDVNRIRKYWNQRIHKDESYNEYKKKLKEKMNEQSNSSRQNI